jgi:hypothetical protein
VLPPMVSDLGGGLFVAVSREELFDGFAVIEFVEDAAVRKRTGGPASEFGERGASLLKLAEGPSALWWRTPG